MTTIYNNSKIHYSSTGSGNPLVLLHGFLESSSIWKDSIRRLSPRRQIISLDLPGHGQSECLQTNHSMEALAACVHFVLEELGIPKADLLGHSMGGYVALAFMEEFPEKSKKIILLNSTPAADTEERKMIRDRSIALVKKNQSAYIRMAISNLLTPDNSKKFQEETQDLTKKALQFPLDGITKALHGMKERKDRTEALKNFSGEKYILAGKQDPLLEHEQLKQLAMRSKTRFHSLSDGHLGYLENKEEFLNFLQFIE